MNREKARKEFPTRLFEIAEVPEESPWHTPLKDEHCIVGAIVRWIDPENNWGDLQVVQAAPTNFPRTGTKFLVMDSELRLLNLKDEKKVLKKWNQLPEETRNA